MCKIWGSESEMNVRVLLIGAALLVCLGPARADNDVAALTVEPSAVELQGPGADHGFLVSADALDVTKEAACVSSNPKVVSADPGRLTARGDGEAEVTVTYGGKSARIKVVASATGKAVAP